MLYIKDKISMTCKRLQNLMKTVLFEVETEAVECGYKNDNIPPAEGWKKIDYLYGDDRHYWQRGYFKTPPAEEGYFFMLEVSDELASYPSGLLYLNGKMVQGLDDQHKETYLEPDVTYEMYNYIYTGKNVYNPNRNPVFSLHTHVVRVDVAVEQLYYDLLVPLEALEGINKNTTEYAETLQALERAVNLIDFRDPQSESFRASIARASALLQEEYYDVLCSVEGKPIVHCIGHTHIDVEWLWNRNQTREKIQRSFSTAAALMKKYPEYQFTLSQPELYRYLKEEAPEKYDELKKLIADGRWEPEGAMWVEADCNVTGGESFVRQIMHGKRFFKEEFGAESRVLFLPDVFGYSAALPQILKKSGVDYFVTSKISWNDTNTLPYDSFMWQGIDGTEIFSSFITTTKGANPNHEMERYTTYVGMLQPASVMGCWDRYQQKEYNKNVLFTYGYGDGGGGPTRWMLEKQRRMAKGLPGMPVTKMNFLLPYLQASEAEFKKNVEKIGRIPKWVGELYLEFHRGTYTTMAENKRGNRKAELMLQKAEALSATDFYLGGSYDAKGLYAAWRKVLHNQFHDILPGSSIQEVYEGTGKDYAALSEYGNGLISDKLQSIAARVKTDGGTLVYNPSSFARKGAVKVGGKTVELTETVPAYGWKVVRSAANNSVIVDGMSAENAFYRMTLNEYGSIVSLYDKEAEREIFLSGQAGNEFQLFEDYPRKYDAWEIDATYKTKRYAWNERATIAPITDGSRSGFLVKRPYMNSMLEQKIWLYSENRRIDFETEIDWHEKHHLMKVAFPVDVHTDKATYEIQFGHVQRPTHENTSWDEAKFEVCAHKWSDVAENGYGVALLNDCKYGFNAEGSIMKLTVLKCPAWPNPAADEGKHSLTYSLLPHQGSLYEAGVIREAYALNQPMDTVELPAQTGDLPAEFSLVSCDRENVVIEAVKKAEDSDAMIVRLYESFNSRCNVTVTVPEKFNKVTLCDLMENDLQPLTLQSGKFTLLVKNFEIITLKFAK
ncbi:MAG: alpha-mannosidase [Clostridia bacterium]|nr:alpha-mannosidase [Clostridia bacterium]